MEETPAGEPTALTNQVERVRGSGILDRSHSLARLFDYLAEAAGAGRSLRETDVAQDVFGRTGDLSGDASVRVYIHRLRRKLNDFYAGPGAQETHRLSVPVGEYRLVVEAAPDALEAQAPEALRRRPRLWVMAAAAGVILLLLANLAAWAVISREQAPSRELARLSRTPLWSGISGDRPVLVVVGDYYIFGERGQSLDLQRMVRDFDINSTEDFDEMLMRNPDLAGRYVDLNTYYTPIGATLALQRVLPLVRHAAGGADRVRVVTSSQLTPELLKRSDVVYVGYFSALRLLEMPLFNRSRFKVGSSYDELIDRKSGRAYVSGAGMARGDEPNDDYGYVGAFGVSDRRIIIIAGTRDIGVIQAAELATDLSVQAAAPPLTNTLHERLYRVPGMGRTNFGGIPIAVDGDAPQPPQPAQE